MASGSVASPSFETQDPQHPGDRVAPSSLKGGPPGSVVSPLAELLRPDDLDLIATFVPFRSGRWSVR